MAAVGWGEAEGVWVGRWREGVVVVLEAAIGTVATPLVTVGRIGRTRQCPSGTEAPIVETGGLPGLVRFGD